MISVAAELVGMHPQTLRIYEGRGLVQPRRTPGNHRHRASTLIVMQLDLNPPLEP